MRFPTIKDVATDAQVSVSTVSLVLSDHPRITPATKASVRRSVTKLGYVYNRRAADLRSQRTSTLGLVVTDVRNPYFAELSTAIEQRAFEHGYTTLYGSSHDDLERQQSLLEVMVEYQVRGLILLPANGTDASALRSIVHGHLPVILVARRVTGYDADYCGVDNVASGKLIGAHFRDIGARRIAFLGGPPLSSARSERLQGLERGLENGAAGVMMSIPSPAQGSGGAAAVDELLAADVEVDAIATYSDTVAFGVMNRLRARGLRPGQDIAVASFDNVTEAQEQEPPLTSVDGFPERIGAAAVARLVGLDEEGEAAERVEELLAPRLHVRESTTSWRRPVEERVSGAMRRA